VYAPPRVFNNVEKQATSFKRLCVWSRLNGRKADVLMEKPAMTNDCKMDHELCNSENESFLVTVEIDS